ncbi:efflux RND transporter periplasmic adaptor subunit [Acetobacter estunensis]|nr:efflux RND transporter periplasmic adaptor subunit [Acetobacter estunensis]
MCRTRKDRIMRQSRLIFCLLPLTLAGCHKKKPAPEIRPVRSLVVQPQQGTDTLSLTGQVTAHRYLTLSFRLPGKIVERTVSAGSVVHAGQLLARLDDTVPRQALRSATAEAGTARAALAQMTPLKRRADVLLPVKAISRNEYDDIVRRYRSAQEQVQATQAQVRIAQEELDRTRLLADEDGIITDRMAEAGEVIAPGQAIFRLATNAGRDAQFDIPEDLLQSRVTVGTPLSVCLDAEPQSCSPAQVYEISPDADALTRTYRTKALLLQPPATMALGSVVVGRISATGHDATFHLPPSALTTQDGKPAVWIVAPDALTVSQRLVNVGRYTTNDVSIASGLRAGDRVVTAGVQVLYPGEKVSLLDEADVRP